MTTGAKNYLMSRNTTTSVHLTGKQQNIGKLVISIKNTWKNKLMLKRDFKVCWSFGN